METNLDTKIIAHSEGGVSQPMEGSTFSAVPPGFEDLKGEKGCSSSSLDKPNPDSTVLLSLLSQTRWILDLHFSGFSNAFPMGY